MFVACYTVFNFNCLLTDTMGIRIETCLDNTQQGFQLTEEYLSLIDFTRDMGWNHRKKIQGSYEPVHVQPGLDRAS